jgi:transketolase
LEENEKYTNTGSKDTRSGFGAGMTELGQKKRNVVALCADLIGSLKFDDFKTIQSVFFQIELQKQT